MAKKSLQWKKLSQIIFNFSPSLLQVAAISRVNPAARDRKVPTRDLAGKLGVEFSSAIVECGAVKREWLWTGHLGPFLPERQSKRLWES